jgi:hypothetical protein
MVQRILRFRRELRGDDFTVSLIIVIVCRNDIISPQSEIFNVNPRVRFRSKGDYSQKIDHRLRRFPILWFSS